MNLAQRSTASIAWNATASILGAVILFGRSIVLARLLPVDIFGVYAFAASIVTLSSIAADLGIGSAFVYRSVYTEQEDQAATVHFTLKIILALIWGTILSLWAIIFTSEPTRTALLLLIVITALDQLTYTPRVILVRRVVHRRLALLELVGDVLSTALAVALAWQGFGLWALVSTTAVGIVVHVVGLYVWQPVWRPHLTWSPPAMRHFLSFGSQVFLAGLLARALDQVDDLWTGAFLGNTALGFYSRAHTFATYPRRVLATPVNSVAGGTYAELQGDRKRMSIAFFRINALLTRSGFLIAGAVSLIAPEFIRLLLGDKWLPMLDAFRLMLIYTLFDPMKGAIANLIEVGIGKPYQVIRIRLIQLTILVAGLLTLGPSLGITGVALAVDIMLVSGIVILLWQTRAYIDFSLIRLFAAPGLALGLGLFLARAAIALPGIAGSDWRTGAVKLVTFSSAYGVTLLMLERDQFRKLLPYITQLLPWPAKVVNEHK